jgi:hypothetical protein
MAYQSLNPATGKLPKKFDPAPKLSDGDCNEAFDSSGTLHREA